MWKEVKNKLKEQIQENEYSLWLNPVRENKFENQNLLLDVPNEYFKQKIENNYKDLIQEIAKNITNLNIELSFNILPVEIPVAEPIIVKKRKTCREQRRELTTFDNSPNFKSQKEMDLYLRDPEKTTTESLSSIQLKHMPGKYGTKAIATFTSFDSRYFTYPSDKRKSTEVTINVKNEDGTETEYFLNRGLSGIGLPPEVQLNTTHAKILLTIVYIWQKQGCLFVGTKENAVVDISMRELAQELGYKNSKIGGQTLKWLYTRIQELFKVPYLISNDIGDWSLFRFVTNINAWSNKNNYDKSMVRLTFHHFISRQLYERKTFLRNTDCFKIKNPTAFKFLFRYDKKIFMGNKLKLSIQELAKDLQIESKRKDSIVRTFKTALKELNRYKLNDNYSLNVELVKEVRQYFIIAERVAKPKEIL